MAGRIPQTFIDDLLAKTDIVQVIENRISLKKHGKEFTACCPFHNEKTPSFTVSPQKQFFHCFGCGANGSAISFLMDYENLSFVEAIESLADVQGLEIPREDGNLSEQPRDHLQPLYNALKQASQYYQQQLRHSEQAIQYLKQRGLSGEICRDFGIGYAPPGWDNMLNRLKSNFQTDVLLKAGLLSQNDSGKTYDKFRERIMFPITNHRGQICAFGGRILEQGEPKYLNSPETPVFNKSNTLYGLYEARKAGSRLNHLIIVEGYMDVVALAQAGISNAVATLGTATTSDHIKQLLRGGVNRLIFCFDGDTAGKKAAWRAMTQALPILRDEHILLFLFLPEGEDPDSYVKAQGAETFYQAIDEATPLSEYFFTTLREKHNLATMEGRAQLKLEADTILQSLHATHLRTQLENKLSQLTHLKTPQEAPSSSPHTTFPPRQSQELQITAMRMTISTLLQHPEHPSQLTPDTLKSITQLPGGKLLHSIIEHLQTSPQLTTAQLTERYNNTPYTNIVRKLAAWQPPDNDKGKRITRLNDAIEQLKKQYKEQRLSLLVHRADTGQITTEEKQELTKLLSK